MGRRHRVFISYHHDNDQNYKDICQLRFGNAYDVMIPGDVRIGDIDPNNKTETIRQIIRDEYLRDTTVTIVLVGTQTWQRKHVDWEIGSSIRDTEHNPRSGLLGIILPSYQRLHPNGYSRYTLPPRLHDNVKCGYATLHYWSNDPDEMQDRIHSAYLRRQTLQPDNSFPSFANNRNGGRWHS